MKTRQLVRASRTRRERETRELVALARRRVDANFDTRNAAVGELCDGALILALAAKVEAGL